MSGTGVGFGGDLAHDGSLLGPLGLGAADFGNLRREISDESVFLILESAWDAGVRYFDTAPHYGLGLSERRLGEFLRTKNRDEYIVSTKVGRLIVENPDFDGGLDTEGFLVPATSIRKSDYSRDGVLRSIDASLERLGLDRIDVLYVHDPEHTGDDTIESNLESSFTALNELREEGAVARSGVGSMSVRALELALSVGSRVGGLDTIMLAGRLTLLEHPAHPTVTEGAVEAGVSIVNTGVFNSGLLARAEVPQNANFDYAPADAARLDRARTLAAVSAEHGVDLPTAALHYALNTPATVAIVTGAGKPEQTPQNLERLRTPVPEALWQDLRERKLIP